MKTLTILEDARALIADEKHWTKGVLARNEEGVACGNYAPVAFSFCSIGALRRAAFRGNVSPWRALHSLETSLGSGVPQFNDEHTHAEVLALFDQAIVAEREKEAVCA